MHIPNVLNFVNQHVNKMSRSILRLCFNYLGAICAHMRHFFIQLHSCLPNFFKKALYDALDLTQWKLEPNSFFCFFITWNLSFYRFSGWVLAGIFSRIILCCGLVGFRTVNHQPYQPWLTSWRRSFTKTEDQWLKRCALVFSIWNDQSLKKNVLEFLFLFNSLGAMDAYMRPFSIQLRARLHNFARN